MRFFRAQDFNGLFCSGADDGDEAIANYDREEGEDEDAQYRELDLSELVLEASQVDTTGICTIAKDRSKDLAQPSQSNDASSSESPVSCEYLKYIWVKELSTNINSNSLQQLRT